jgi:hypothetical protein
MATYAYTFTSGDTVTPTKLNNARTVSEIVNADIKSDAAIAGSKLADGAITNAKVDAAAAIAGTKIAPNFGSQNVVTTGNALLGTTAALDVAYGQTSGKLALAGPSQIAVAIGAYSNDQFGSRIDFVKSRSATTNSKTVVQANDGLGNIVWAGTDGTAVIPAASIAGEIDGTPGANDMPGRLTFLTTADGSNSLTERMRITQNGRVGIGTASPSYLLDVAGIVNTNANFAVDGTQVVTNRQTGWGTPSGGTVNRSALTITGSATYQQSEMVTVIATLKAIILDLRDHGLIGN